mgnify:CR=1 FL=1
MEEVADTETLTVENTLNHDSSHIANTRDTEVERVVIGQLLLRISAIFDRLIYSVPVFTHLGE